MRIQWTEVGAAGVLVGAACAVLYAGLKHSLRRTAIDQQASIDRQLAAMATTVRSLQMRVAELNRLAAERADELAALKSSQGNAHVNEAIKPEVLAVITAAATAFLGKTPRIHSARLLPVHDSVSAWTQQGRMIVQTSHNPRIRD